MAFTSNKTHLDVKTVAKVERINCKELAKSGRLHY